MGISFRKTDLSALKDAITNLLPFMEKNREGLF